MAKKKKNTRLIPTYQKALKMAGIDVTGKESITRLRNIWKKVRNDYFTKTGNKLPSVYQYAKEYKQRAQTIQSIPAELIGTPIDRKNIPTIDFAQEYLSDFYDRLEIIMQDTYAFIDKGGDGSYEGDKTAAIAKYHIEEIARVHTAILDELKDMINQYGKDIVAESMAKNVELDYSIAVTLQPPSDIYILLNQTLEQMLAITVQIEIQAAKEAERMENEFLGL